MPANLPLCCKSSAQALHSVFIASCSSTSKITLRAQSVRPKICLFLRPRPSLLPAQNQRLYSNAASSAPAASDGFPGLPNIIYDFKIQQPAVDVIDPRGTFHENVRFSELPQRYDPFVYRIVQIAAATEDRRARCIVMTQESFLRQVLKMGGAGGGAGKKVKVAPAQQHAKTIELNWAITEHDLEYRLKSLQEFLKKGRKVEIAIAPKKKGRRATPEEGTELLKKVRAKIAETPGAKESKESTGAVLKMMSLYVAVPVPAEGEDRASVGG